MIASGRPLALWNVPYRRNPFFTGREEALLALYRLLRLQDSVALCHPQGISGLGGIGKTQMALEYAYRYASEYEAVFWVRADSLTGLFSSFIELAQMLELPERNEQDPRIIVEAVHRWLRFHANWLLIFDNMDDPSLAAPFLLPASRGHTLFTTRAQALGEIAQRFDVQKLESDTGALLLLRRASLLPLQATLNLARKEDYRLSNTISLELDGLPLALDQAGAYIYAAPCTLAAYLELYRQRRSDVLRERGTIDKDYPASVATTWSLSMAHVMEANPASAELLNFCAFLAPDAIPEEMLRIGAAHLGEVLGPVVADVVELDLACKEILRYSLLDRAADEETLTIHRLVQYVIQDTLPAESRLAWKYRAVKTVEEAFPSINFENWTRCERLTSHALTCATWITEEHISIPEGVRLLTQTGTYLIERARFGEVEPLLKRALEINEQQWGPEHPATARSLNYLAALYRAQGNYALAETLMRHALAITEQAYGTDHPEVATKLHNLAALYRDQGENRLAEPLYQRALAIRERRLGVEHPDTLVTLGNLAELYRTQEQYTRAEQLLQRILKLQQEYLEIEQHPEIGKTLHNLAGLYREQGKYEQAEAQEKRALAILEQLLGENHPSTALSLTNLANLYLEQGKYDQAEPLVQRTLAIYEHVWGNTEHLDVASCLNSLAAIRRGQGKYVEAEGLLRRALAIREQQLSAEHPDIANTLNNLAEILMKLGNHTQAEPFLQRAVAIREKQLGPEHSETAASLNNLAALYQRQRKYAQATAAMERVLAIQEKQLGANHPHMATPLNNLAVLFGEQKKYDQAEVLLQRAIAINEKVYGKGHPAVAEDLRTLAQLYVRQKKYQMAEPLLKRAMAICQRELRADHPLTKRIKMSYDEYSGALAMHNARQKVLSFFTRRSD